MRFFSILQERNEVLRKGIEKSLFLEEKAYSNIAQNSHEIEALLRAILQSQKELAAANKEFTEVIRSFFAFERSRRTEEDKRRALEMEEIKPGKHDNLF